MERYIQEPLTGIFKMRIKWFSMVRVTGLLLVLLYHFFKTAFPGGFIGVDISLHFQDI